MLCTTYPPSDRAVIGGGRLVVGLTLDAQVHDVVTADGTGVNYQVPAPQGNSIPEWKKEHEKCLL